MLSIFKRHRVHGVGQVLVLSDEGMIRDVDSLGAQGNSQAMEAVRGVSEFFISFSPLVYGALHIMDRLA